MPYTHKGELSTLIEHLFTLAVLQSTLEKHGGGSIAFHFSPAGTGNLVSFACKIV